MKKKILGAVLLLGGLGIQPVFAANVNANILRWTGMAVSTTQAFDLSAYREFSVQAAYEDASFTADTFTDGNLGTVVITLPTTMTNLIGTKASATVNVATTTGLSGDALVVEGRRYVAGTDWATTGSSTTVATALAAMLAERHPDVTATASGSTVTITARSYGTAGNSLNLSSSDSATLTVSGATLTGGLATPTFTIAGVTLTEKTDFTFTSSSATSAGNLLAAATTHATIGAVYSGSRSNNVVTLTRIAASDTATTASCSTGTITVANTRGNVGQIDVSNDTIYQANHGYTTGLKLLYTKTSGTSPSNLVAGTTYFAIRQSNDYYKVATTANLAVAGTAVDISTVTGGGTFVMTPLAFSGTPSFKWQASNDGTNYTDLSVSSVTYSADGNAIWDFDTYNYKWLRLNFVGPTNGGLAITATLNGKK